MKSFCRIAALLSLVATEMPATSAHAAVKQSLRILSMSDHCVDEFSEDDTVYINEGTPVCKITVQVRGRGKTKSKIALEYYNEEDGWIRTEYKVLSTNAAGKATFSLETDFPNRPEDDCYDNDSWMHRFVVSRVGKYKAFRSAEFEVSYTSAETNPACQGYE